MKTSRFIADFDSASAMLRAVSRFLKGKDFPKLGTGKVLGSLVPLANLLPTRVRQTMYTYGGWQEAVPLGKLDQLQAEDMGEWVVSHYPRRQYPAVMLGSSNGAAVHLCCAMGMPWIPQTLLIPIRRSVSDVDDFTTSMNLIREPAETLLRNNPELQLHHMHDPNQDRLMIRRMGYFRVKRRRLGKAQTEFLCDVLPAGGTLFLLECGLQWPTTQVAERHYFQAGAWGGAEPHDYIQGSERVAQFLKQNGSRQPNWQAPPPDGERPEAEWGFEPALREEVERLAQKQGWRIRRIRFEDPQTLSPLVADLYRWWYEQRGLEANRLLVESFILMEPWWTLQAGAVPFWTTFAVEPSAARLEEYLKESKPFAEIYAMLFSHGVNSIGLAPIERWKQILSLAERSAEFIGVNEKEFPRDFASFVRYHRELRQHAKNGYPMPEPLSLEQLEEFLTAHAGRYAVEFTEGEPGRSEDRSTG